MIVFPRICARPAKLSMSLSHQPPCLVNEFYVLHLEIEYEEEVTVSNAHLSLGLKEGQDTQLEKSSESSFLGTIDKSRSEVIEGKRALVVRSSRCYSIEVVEGRNT